MVEIGRRPRPASPKQPDMEAKTGTGAPAGSLPTRPFNSRFPAIRDQRKPSSPMHRTRPGTRTAIFGVCLENYRHISCAEGASPRFAQFWQDGSSSRWDGLDPQDPHPPAYDGCFDDARQILTHSDSGRESGKSGKRREPCRFSDVRENKTGTREHQRDRGTGNFPRGRIRPPPPAAEAARHEPDEIKRIAAAAEAHGPAILERYLPGGRFESKEYASATRTAPTITPAARKINKHTGEGGDLRSNGLRFGDFVAVVAFALQCGQGEAAAEMRA